MLALLMELNHVYSGACKDYPEAEDLVDTPKGHGLTAERLEWAEIHTIHPDDVCPNANLLSGPFCDADECQKCEEIIRKPYFFVISDLAQFDLAYDLTQNEWCCPWCAMDREMSEQGE